MGVRSLMMTGLLGSSVLLPACPGDPRDPTPAADTGTTGPEPTSTGVVDTGSSGTTGDPLDAILARLAVPCDDPVADVYTAAPPSPWSPQLRGSIAACAYDRELSVDEMAAHFVAHPEFPDPGLSTAAHKLVLSYWTEREPGQPVLTSAALYVPEQLRADPAPLLVLGHGSVGIGDSCAPSREDANGFDKDWKALAYPFAGDGWVVIMPDFPGLGTDGPGTWMLSLDEGHAILDATRAARRLFEPGTFTDQSALVGLSNGGHATLSAQAMLDDYGAEGQVVANVLYSPF
ncbi:MAG: hypothetical protein KDK70_30205, partial [Myxococcales bacterium]|nr:hypothetical protein [Myxococcales bacterium]